MGWREGGKQLLREKRGWDSMLLGNGFSGRVVCGYTNPKRMASLFALNAITGAVSEMYIHARL